MRHTLLNSARRLMRATAIGLPVLVASSFAIAAGPATQPSTAGATPLTAPQAFMSPTVAPTTAPTAAVPAPAVAAVPTTMPQPTDHRTSVLVLPFTPASPNDADWIGRAIQQSMTADLSRPTTGHIMQVVSIASPVQDTAGALAAGKTAGANYVVYGSYQTQDPLVKISGQVINVDSGQSVGGLKAVGSTRDLFDLQDTVSFQARYAMSEQALAERGQVAPSTQPVGITPQGPVMATGSRYDNSDLSRAVNDGQSQLQSDDAAGQAYRRSYYDTNDSYYGGYYGGFYGGGLYGLGIGYYGGSPYDYGFGNSYYGHGHHHDGNFPDPGRFHANPPIRGVDPREFRFAPIGGSVSTFSGGFGGMPGRQSIVPTAGNGVGQFGESIVPTGSSGFNGPRTIGGTVSISGQGRAATPITRR